MEHAIRIWGLWRPAASKVSGCDPEPSVSGQLAVNLGRFWGAFLRGRLGGLGVFGGLVHQAEPFHQEEHRIPG